jgi:hypothetical protein
MLCVRPTVPWCLLRPCRGHSNDRWDFHHHGFLRYGSINAYFTCHLNKYCVGTSFWDTGILTFTRLDRIPRIAELVPNVGLNEAFMIFGGVALAFNILARYRENLYLMITRSSADGTTVMLMSTRPQRLWANPLLGLSSSCYHSP